MVADKLRSRAASAKRTRASFHVVVFVDDYLIIGDDKEAAEIGMKMLRELLGWDEFFYRKLMRLHYVAKAVRLQLRRVT